MSSKPVVLIIDDEEDFCYFIRLNLESTGKYKVLTANNGQKGLELARNNKPDLILLDLLMPGLHGSEVAAQLMEDQATKDIPVIFITAAVKAQEIGARAKKVGGRLIITKPFTFDFLVSHIEKTLKRPTH